ncbi:hypothetical protein AOL_s00076g418 [Orbilia oligospora ATCC 24927]|uniref:Uncharacterized protein n=1 Tax=Arthrobotrys oligospora (strain ATCC 24927 / CBS 115.81 / DSM 1491) TaxID=756982 RepID=G1X9S9_ARTOA|nr:hypothetical protein AOL_s00076g418 [Orbilia oligospora ATCC 24927]EGX50067.1 hypothetical protein AOL_s00076g418 [Orbilia oligospora ATCC 24927]
MAPIATTSQIFQPYVKELKKRLQPIERAMGQLSPKLIISRDVINSVLADLLVSLQYSVHTPEYDPGQVSYLVNPILEEIRRNLRPNHERRLRWLAAFRRSLQPMHRVNEWTRGDPPTGYLAIIREDDPVFYEFLDCLRHKHMCLEYLEFEFPKLLTAADSLVKLMTGETSIYRIPAFPRLKLMGHSGRILIADFGTPQSSTLGSSSQSGQPTSQSSQSDNQYIPSDSQSSQSSFESIVSTYPPLEIDRNSTNSGSPSRNLNSTPSFPMTPISPGYRYK